MVVNFACLRVSYLSSLSKTLSSSSLLCRKPSQIENFVDPASPFVMYISWQRSMMSLATNNFQYLGGESKALRNQIFFHFIAFYIQTKTKQNEKTHAMLLPHPTARSLGSAPDNCAYIKITSHRFPWRVFRSLMCK